MKKTTLLLLSLLFCTLHLNAQPKLDTTPLTLEGDIASHLVAGVDQFLLDELAASVAKRPAYWNRDFSSHEAYVKSVEPNRERLAYILGLRDSRTAFAGLQLDGTTAARECASIRDEVDDVCRVLRDGAAECCRQSSSGTRQVPRSKASGRSKERLKSATNARRTASSTASSPLSCPPRLRPL